MTASEKKIWLLAVGVVGLVLAYRLGFSRPERPAGPLQSRYTLSEARRLLRAGPVIVARDQAAAASLQKLRSHFWQAGEPSAAKLKLLCLLDDLARQSDLRVELKNAVALAPAEPGVSLEGVASAQVIVDFLQRLTSAPIRLKVKQLQLHSVPEQKVLNYRMVLSTLALD